ncbi:helix-turn-helix transcriptional regulator [Pseudomonas oryzihabitans]|uniref:helix-turn-helix transcriptional regulator n=1 Tax=Pseudomonas oryzihabitans TaxID=47885 RepID=UPI0015E3FDBF|nr:AlpA family phage regulatory protein [Pseudomonas psychrotolerans]MBA1213929.1 AlpA family phage regulatory protein [Pseudomonas psychrotolerans]
MAALTNSERLPRRFIKISKVKDYTSLSTSEIYRRVAAGTFPAQVNIGPKSVAWIESEVVAWCDELASQREVV